MESGQPHRRRRKRRRRSHRSSDSSSPKPLSIDLLKKKRHKNAKRKRIASARLDLDEGTTFQGATSRGKFLGNLLAVVVVVAGVVLVLNDIGWGVIRDGLSDFIVGVGRGAQESISGGRAQQAAAISEMTIGEEPARERVSNIFRPEASQEALQKMSLAIEAKNVGLTDQAVNLLSEARELDPEAVGVSLMKAYVFKEAGDLDRAVEHFQDALKHSGEKLFAAQDLGKIFYDSGEFGESSKYLAMARKWKPDEPVLAHQLSRALRMAGRPLEGLFEARQAHDMFPENKLYEISARLAAIQAGEASPPAEPEAPAPPRPGRNEPAVRSPFERVVDAGFAIWQGQPEKANEIWKEIEVHMDILPVLKELEEDPIFRQNEINEGGAPSMSP